MRKDIFRIGIILISVFLMNFNLINIVSAENNTTINNQEKNLNENVTYNDFYQLTQNYKINNLKNSKIARDVKGLFITGYTANNPKFDYLLNLVNNTDLNSFVIDVKNDSGHVTYNSNIEQVNLIGADDNNIIDDIDMEIENAKENNIYTIARIVTFKDPYLAGANPDLAIKKKNGGVWRDGKGVSWVDPYKKEVWDYNIAIAKEAAEKGFDEIQFDYVRFPDNAKKLDREVIFDNTDNKSKAENIAEFLVYAKEELKDYSVFISADVFGLTTTVVDDMGIGQQWELITTIVDYICPMMYPSHYGKGLYGLAIPNAQPYNLIYSGLEDALEKNTTVNNNGKKTAIIRPWYQDFTMGGIPYGPVEVQAQIDAGIDLGVPEYLIWNASNNYSEATWLNK